jgi:endonuclease G
MLYELVGDVEIGDGEDDGDDDDGGDTPVVPPTEESWLELPATRSDGAFPRALTVTVMDGEERNYTHYYDIDTYTTLWVAYPLESRHMGSISRPSNWDWNPYISTEYQVDLRSRSYTNSDTYVRGHLIPNASRNGIRNMQLQTFYVTNSVPQVQNSFNSGVWSTLESSLQTIAKSETIYIVTGVAFNKVGESKAVSYTAAKEASTDGVIKQCPIPNYFYKVVLKVEKSGDTVTSASTIGFWFENRSHKGSFESYAYSVDTIEAWTGFDFFHALDDNIEIRAEQNAKWHIFEGF